LRTEYERGRRTAPEVTLIATNSLAVAALLSGREAELGFVEGPSVPRGLRSRVVARDRLVVVVRRDHPWARRKAPVSPAELAATPLVEREEGSGTRQSLHQTLAGCLGSNIELAAPAMQLTTSTAIRQAVSAGAGPAVLSILAVHDVLAAGLLTVVPVAGIDFQRKLRAVWLGADQPPAGPPRDLVAIAARLGAPPDPERQR